MPIRALQQTKTLLDAIAQAKLRAFTNVLPAQALAAAQACDASPVSPLNGMNFAIKDNIDTEGALCSAGLPFLQRRRATSDAAVVADLRAAGAVILGVTATDAGGFGVTTPDVVNPTFPERIAGGSSGGSAAAVAAFLCDAALGTDTGGSVRIPAACCGVYGFKPTHGVISMTGIRPMTQSFDHVGVLARCIPEIRKIVAVLAPLLDATQIKHQPRIAVPWPNLAGIDPAIAACLGNLQSNLRNAGFQLVETALPPFVDILAVHIGLSLSEAAALYTNLSATDREGLPSAMRTGLALGHALTETRKSDLTARRAAILAAIDRVFDAADYLLLPTLPIQPPLVGVRTASVGGEPSDILNALIRFTAPFNQTGHPALAFPWANSESGLSFSLQLVGRRNADMQLLDFAASL